MQEYPQGLYRAKNVESRNTLEKESWNIMGEIPAQHKVSRQGRLRPRGERESVKN